MVTLAQRQKGRVAVGISLVAIRPTALAEPDLERYTIRLPA